MATDALGGVVLADRQWFIVGRWQEYAGEARANLLRIIAIGVFYSVQLLRHYYFLPAAAREADGSYHQSITALAVAWTMMSLAVLLCLRRQIFPAALKYISTAGDLVLLTAMAALAKEPANTPLVYLYFPVIALAAVRFSLGLVWFATLGSMACYLGLVGKGDDVWFDAQHTTEPVTQLVMLLSLGSVGEMLGQMIRRMRSMADDYVKRLERAGT